MDNDIVVSGSIGRCNGHQWTQNVKETPISLHSHLIHVPKLRKKAVTVSKKKEMGNRGKGRVGASAGSGDPPPATGDTQYVIGVQQGGWWLGS